MGCFLNRARAAIGAPAAFGEDVAVPTGEAEGSDDSQKPSLMSDDEESIPETACSQGNPKRRAEGDNGPKEKRKKVSVQKVGFSHVTIGEESFEIGGHVGPVVYVPGNATAARQLLAYLDKEYDSLLRESQGRKIEHKAEKGNLSREKDANKVRYDHARNTYVVAYFDDKGNSHLHNKGLAVPRIDHLGGLLDNAQYRAAKDAALQKARELWDVMDLSGGARYFPK